MNPLLTTAEEKLHEILADLRHRQKAAANRSKPALWAYYIRVRRDLEKWFENVKGHGATAGAALALIQRAEDKQKSRSPFVAARWASLAVYARRILREWCPGRKLRKEEIGNLEWLRRRAEEN